ncbi:MAG: hypothetical protein P8Y58_17500 [Novosphingobium sp.]
MRLGLGEQADQQPPQLDRFARQIRPGQRCARGGGVAFVEYQIDDPQHGFQAIRQLGGSGDLIGNARVADFGLGAHDALGQGRQGNEKGMGDFFGGETAYLAQGKGDLGVRRQGRVAAGEDQPQKVVLDLLALAHGAVVVRGGDRPAGIFQRVQARPAAMAVDGLEAADRDQPCPGIVRFAFLRPLFEGGPKGIVQRFLGQVEVAQPSNERGEDAARLCPVDRLDSFPYTFSGIVAY